MPTIDLRDWVGLAAARRESGYSDEWLRHKCDTGQVRTLRDPAGRRLIHREDVLRLTEERSRRMAAASNERVAVNP